MDGRDFFNRVNDHSNMTWLGVREGKTPADDEVLVEYKPTQSKFAISVFAIIDNSWDELESVITGQRQPRIMTHVTRIVGYYSQLQNWNRSKLAELRDRHKGDYAVPAETPKVFVTTSTPRVPQLAVATASD